MWPLYLNSCLYLQAFFLVYSLGCLSVYLHQVTDWRGGAYEPHNSQPPGGDTRSRFTFHISHHFVFKTGAEWTLRLFSLPVCVCLTSKQNVAKIEEKLFCLVRSPCQSSSCGRSSGLCITTSSALLQPIITSEARGGFPKEEVVPNTALTSVRLTLKHNVNI